MSIIPSGNLAMESYNSLLSRLSLGSFSQKTTADLNITQIFFEHPLFANVFEKKVENFQYPKVSQYVGLQTKAGPILSFQDGNPFLVGRNGIYVFCAPLSHEYSNFKQSPLIVPTFYKMGINSLKLPDLYHTIGKKTVIDVPQELSKDDILKVAKDDYEFIPQQRSYAKKVSLTFTDAPKKDGIYGISSDGSRLANLSFNYGREESSLEYLDLDQDIYPLTNDRQGTIATLFQKLQNEDRITPLWKWFAILAMLFLLTEILILKFLK